VKGEREAGTGRILGSFSETHSLFSVGNPDPMRPNGMLQMPDRRGAAETDVCNTVRL